LPSWIRIQSGSATLARIQIFIADVVTLEIEFELFSEILSSSFKSRREGKGEEKNLRSRRNIFEDV
jgi:hypothetical protein